MAVVQAPGTAAPEGSTLPVLGPDSRLGFPPLAILAEGEGYLVGDPATGTFLALPEVGVVALRALQAGGTIARAATAAAAHAGQDVDVLDFAQVLVAAGLVAAVDGVPPGGAAAPPRRGWLAGVRPALVRPFFSAPAWGLYGLAFAACLALFLARPRYRPAPEDVFFYPDPAVCLVAITAVGALLGAGHEAAHWLAARAAGVAARFSVSRRLFFLVFETDLSQLWAVPRRRRYGPFLAGMAFDTVVLAACLGLRLGYGTGRLALPPLLDRVLATLVLMQVLALGWQTLVFLRTDLYAVLATALGCYNLFRVTSLTLWGRLRRLAPDEAAELATAHPRDRRVARWFAWLALAGLLWAALVFVKIFLPNTAIMAGWVLASLRGARLSSGAFWEALGVGLVAALQALLPLALLIRQRLSRRGGRVWPAVRLSAWRWPAVLALLAAVAVLLALVSRGPDLRAAATVAALPGEEVPIMADLRHIPAVGAPHAPYSSLPPTSGPHVPQTVATGVYRAPIPEELQVHALEHGHVLLQYAPGTPPEQVRALEAVARRFPRQAIVAPYEGLRQGIALTAWGRLERLERADPERAAAFVAALAGRYHHGWQR